MKEEQKVYIKGVPDRGEEVIKMLKDLGAKENFYPSSGSNEKFVYFINHKGVIDYEYLDTEPGQIIMDNYKEIKLPEKWKNGDILFSKADNEFAVFEVEHINSNKFFSYLATCYAGYLTYQDIPKKDFRLATKSEVAQFHERLHAINKDWDAEKKQLIDWKWMPEMGHWFHFIDIDGRIKLCKHDEKADYEMLDFGNYFHTKEEAEAMAEKIKKLLNAKS